MTNSTINPAAPASSTVAAASAMAFASWKRLSLDDLRRMTREAIQEASERACQTAYLGDHVSLCRVLTRYMMHVDTRDIGLTPHLLLTGYWETWITQAVCRTVRPGMCAVDVGANNGYFSLLLADLVGHEGRLFALEPNPGPFSLLRRNITLNGFGGRTTLLAQAADAEDRGQVTLRMPQDDPGLASIVPELFADAPPASMKSVTCSAVRLDTILADEPRVDFIKVDAEGAEPMIWEGMQATLRRHADVTVALEFTPGRYRDPKRFLAAAERDGFTLRHVLTDGSVTKASAADILAHDWVMLWLQRG